MRILTSVGFALLRLNVKIECLYIANKALYQRELDKLAAIKAAVAQKAADKLRRAENAKRRKEAKNPTETGSPSLDIVSAIVQGLVA